MLLSHDDILKAEDRPTETVEVPEWGGSVLVRGLDGKGRDEYFASMVVLRKGPRGQVQQGMDNANATAKLVARCIIGEDGERMFADSEIDALGAKSGAALDRVFSAAQRLSGLSDEDLAELGKGSASTPSEPSTTRWPEISPSPPSGSS